MTEDGDENPTETLQKIETKFQETAPTLGDSLGAPVMQLITSGGDVVAMEGFEDLTELNDNVNVLTLIEQFQADQAAKLKIIEEQNNVAEISEPTEELNKPDDDEVADSEETNTTIVPDKTEEDPVS